MNSIIQSQCFKYLTKEIPKVVILNLIIELPVYTKILLFFCNSYNISLYYFFLNLFREDPPQTQSVVNLQNSIAFNKLIFYHYVKNVCY